MTIISKPASEAYRDNWERTFGAHDEGRATVDVEPNDCEQPDGQCHECKARSRCPIADGGRTDDVSSDA